MKKIILIITNLLIIAFVIAQTPAQFKYQAVLRDASGNILANQNKTVVIDILQGTPTGTSVFNESHSVTTTAQGLINLNIGSIENLNGIDWSSDEYFIQITVDGTIMGTSQLLSVPYALQAKEVENVNYSQIIGTPSIPNDISQLTDNSNLLFNGDYHSLFNLPVLFDGNYNSLSNLPDLFNGNWNSLTNTPTTISGYGITDAFDGSWANLTGKPIFATVATSGSYSDLTNSPDLSTYATKNMNNQNITNLANPVNAQDAATKAYVDLLEARLNELEILFYGVTDIDGNFYNGIKIGNQIWMAEDLRVTRYPNGDAIPNVTVNSTWAALADDNTSDAYCFQNNDNSTDYGALYTYAAAIGDNWVRDNATGQGVCPDGWHLPTDNEWTTLINTLGGLDVAGGKMKETGTVHWQSPNNGATNESGFKAIGGGARYPFGGGDFTGLRVAANWWSATQYTGTDAWFYYLGNTRSEAFRSYNSKSYGFSVRCVKN